MDEHKWIESRFDAIDKEMKSLCHMMKNHLQHHFIFCMGALAAVVALGATLIKVFWG